MNDNVTPFRKKRVTASPSNLNRKSIRSEEFKVENVSKIAMQYAPVPAWVAARPVLNRSVTLLRESGWRIDCYPGHRILCFHSRVQNANGVHIIEAMEIEMVFREQNKKGGVA